MREKQEAPLSKTGESRSSAVRGRTPRWMVATWKRAEPGELRRTATAIGWVAAYFLVDFTAEAIARKLGHPRLGSWVAPGIVGLLVGRWFSRIWEQERQRLLEEAERKGLAEPPGEPAAPPPPPVT